MASRSPVRWLAPPALAAAALEPVRRRIGLLLVLGATLAAAAGTPAAAPASPAHAPSPPRLTARAAILVQPQTGDVVYALRPDQERPIASTTKLMTALVTLERSPLDRRVRAANYPAGPAESVIGLRAGERLTVRDLLRGMLLASGNDAAVTLADGIGGTEGRFIAAMNAHARRLALRHTHYATPVGLDTPGNYSTARDLTTLATFLLRDRFFAQTVALPAATLRSGAAVRRVVNRNTLVRELRWVDGVKTGYTHGAGNVLVSASRRGGVELVAAVLGEPSESARDADSLALLRYGQRRYHDPVVVRAGQVLAHARIKYRDGRVALLAQSTVNVVLRRGESVRVGLGGVPLELDGPLAAGDRVGTAVVTTGPRVLARVPVVVARPVSKATLGQRASSFFGGSLVLALVAILVVSSLLLAALRRRGLRGRRREAPA